MMLTAEPLRRRGLLWVLAVIASLLGMSAVRAQGDAAQHVAPKGELRVAVLTNNPFLVARGTDGQFGGLLAELANSFGSKLGVPVHWVPYDNQTRYNLSIGKDEWDIGFVPRDLSRTSQVAYSDVVLEVDNSYVARVGLSSRTPAELDRPGIRVAVAQGSSLDGYLTRNLKSAQIVRLPVGQVQAREALSSRAADLYADATPIAYRIAAEVAGATVLLGRINSVQIAIAVPKSNVAGLSAVNEVVKDLKQGGMIAEMIKRANLRGVRAPR